MRYLRCLSLPLCDADEMIARFEAERDQDTESRRGAINDAKAEIKETDGKLGLLMQAYLDKILSLDEYRQAKNDLIERKQELKEKLDMLEANRGNWFEPAIRFVKATKQALFLTENGSGEKQRDFLRKVGSNLTISNRHLSVVPRKPWQLVVDKGPFAQHNAASVFSDAAFIGEKSLHLQLAERGGFSERIAKTPGVLQRMPIYPS